MASVYIETQETDRRQLNRDNINNHVTLINVKSVYDTMSIVIFLYPNEAFL